MTTPTINPKDISDYYINGNKSIIFPLYKDFEITRIKNNQFKTGNIKYLRIHFSNISDLFDLNFTPALKTTENNLKRWMNLPLSIIGRIATIKMSVLQKINYLFTMILIQSTKKYIRLHNNFYWKNRNLDLHYEHYKNIKSKEDYQHLIFNTIFLHRHST